MQKEYKFQLEEAVEIPNWAEDYPTHKFTVAKACFLSTKPNSHGLIISADVLREYASTILGNFVVAKIEWGDSASHDVDEIIYGYAPKEQDVEFVEEDSVLKAYCYFVISKRYSKEFNGIFEFDNFRNSSVEMTVTTKEENEDEVVSFDIYGLTVLGKKYNGSCPDANFKLVRFQKATAEKFFKKNDGLSVLKNFANERKQTMAEKKTYKIDKSKESLSDTPWSDVDKEDLRNKIMDADNRDELVKACYLLIEDGWQDAPSEHLKYPVMEIKEDVLVYNRHALSSALAYAKKENEQSVVDKVEKIYKNLNLDNSDGKEEKKMSEIEFSAVNIGDLWSLLWNKIREHDAWEYYIMGIYEQDNKKFAIIADREQKIYRLDFSLTEDGMVVADEVVEVKQEFVETDNMKKFAEPDNVEEYRFAEEAHEHDENCDCVECKMKKMESRITELESCVEEKDNIIMGKDKELEELRQFKNTVEEKEKAVSVEAIMTEVKDCLTDEQFKQFREEGMACEMAQVDGWANSVKAVAFSQMKKQPAKKNDAGVWSFGAPIQSNDAKSVDIWERLGKQYNI